MADPLNSNTFYAGVNTFNHVCSALNSGIYKTTNVGANWSKVSDAAMETVIGTSNCHFEIAVGRNVGTNSGETGNVFVSMVCRNGTLDALFRSGNAGGSWTAMDIPETTDVEGVVGLHPGGQGNTHSSIAVDPTDDNIVYIGGDRQPFGFPNTIGANDFSGRSFRGDASQSPGTQMTPLTHNGTASNSSPHADSRDMEFDANGNLIEVDDGGIFKRLMPSSTAGDWVSLNGDLMITEQHDTSYDANSAVVVSGNQDNGTSVQSQFASTTWNNFFNADGGDVAIDAISLAGANQSVRFYSFQNLGNFKKTSYDQNNSQLSQATPARTVINGGAALVPQFITPLAINNTDGNRMILGGSNGVYESSDHADTISAIAPNIVVNANGGNNIGYGAFANPDILYIGGVDNVAGTSGVYLRTTAAGAFTQVYTGSIQGLSINPGNPAEAFLIESSRVFHTTNTGASWNEITGTGLNNFGQLRSIAFMQGATDMESKLAIGTNRGVFQASAQSGFATWSIAAAGMPNAPVFELLYDAPSDRLIAGTMGRGSFVLTSMMGGNSPPVIGAETIAVAKGGTATTVVGGATSLIANDTDPDMGDVLTMDTTAVIAPMNGLLTLNSNGTFSYQHDDSFTSTDMFIYRVCDDGTPQMCADGQVDIAIDIAAGAVCSSPNIGIPDGDPMGVSDMLTMNTSGLITDLNVFVEINHTWVGDIKVSLTHMSSGTEVILIDQPGVPASAFGCAADDISAIMDDVGASPVEDQCDNVGPIAITGTFSPNEMLSDFNALELSGNWVLKVTDAAAQISGTLVSWCLDPTTGSMSMPPVLAGIGDKSVDELTNLAFTATATDSDTAQNDLVFSLSGEPTGASISSAGVFSFTPTEAQGPDTYTFNVMVSDDSMPALTDSEEITVTVAEVNQFPVLDPIGNKTVEVLETLSFTATGSDPDLPLQTLTFYILGAPSGASINPFTGDFSFTPTKAQGPAMYSFEVGVIDNGGGSFGDTEIITVEVTNAGTSGFCSSPNALIPDNDIVTGVTDTITMMTGGQITDLNVTLAITHTWVGDITATLTHVSSGTEVILIDRPGDPASNGGCFANDISATLDDAGATAAEDECDTVGAIAITGIFSPNEMLSGFNGLELSGDWTLNVTDAASGDTGSLVSWCLDPTTATDVIFENGFEMP